MSNNNDLKRVIKEAKEEFGDTGVYIVGFIVAIVMLGLAITVGFLSYYAYIYAGWIGSVLIISIGLHTVSQAGRKWIWIILSFVSAMAVMMM